MNQNELEFGTAGIRGIIGNGKNHLNEAHVLRIFDAYGKYLNENFTESNKIVVIGRDNRQKSTQFAQIAARMLAKHKINVLISEDILATPIISYVTRITKNSVGAVNITASHNPKEYNGIKLYDKFGTQLLPDAIHELLKYFLPYENYENKKIVLPTFKDNRFIKFISQTLIDNYLKEILKIGSKRIKSCQNISLAYSPQHGTGIYIAKKLFKALETNAFFVKEQMIKHTMFPNTKSPNPENPECYEKLITLGLEKKCDIILTTDPDSDRIGLGVYNNQTKTYQLLNGNETAILIFHYLVDFNKDDLKNKYLIYSFVSSSLPAIIAKENGIKVYEVATGFKWMGSLIEELKTQASNEKLLFAFEESYGSLINAEVSHDKDAFQSLVILTKMASEYQKQSKTLIDVLDDIYNKYGYIKSQSISVDLAGKNNNYLQVLKEKFKKLSFSAPTQLEDYIDGLDYIAPSDMIKIKIAPHDWIALRPSGTEPKIKFYIFASANTQIEAQSQFDKYYQMIKSIL